MTRKSSSCTYVILGALASRRVEHWKQQGRGRTRAVSPSNPWPPECFIWRVGGSSTSSDAPETSAVASSSFFFLPLWMCSIFHQQPGRCCHTFWLKTSVPPSVWRKSVFSSSSKAECSSVTFDIFFLFSVC